jgi:DNA-binding MarR family transcriptional regulator
VTDPAPLAAGHPSVPLARLLAMAYRHLVVGLHERLAARGWRDVRPQYGYVLLACRDRPTTSGELAGMLGVSKQAASKLADAMVEEGLLVQVEDIYLELEQEWADVLGRPRVEQVRGGLVEVLTSAYGGELPPVRPV